MNENAAGETRRRSLLPHRNVLIAAGAALFLVFLVAGAPARPLAALLMQKQPGLQLLDVSGSAWQGTAAGTAIRIGQHWLFLGQGEWRFNPLWLLIGKTALHWQSRRPELELEGQVELRSGGELRLQDTRIFTQAILVHPWLPQNLAPMGALGIRLQEFTWDNGVQALELNAGWEDARIFFNNQEWALGGLEINAQHEGEGRVGVQVRDMEQGPLKLDLFLQYKEGNLDLRGELSTRENAGQRWQQLLRDLLGKAREDGVFELNIQHKFGPAAQAPAAGT